MNGTKEALATMHSTQALTSKMFPIRDQGGTVPSFAELCQGFSARDRLGVIVREPMAAIWHSAFILAAVTAFYDEQRKCNPEFFKYRESFYDTKCFIYPDFFIFHVGFKPDDYGMFDIWPMHKCLYVEDDPEEIARAVNDRAISILLLSRPRASEGKLEVQTRNSALSRIHHAFSASSEGSPEGAVTIGGNPVVEQYVGDVISQAQGLSESEKELLLSRRLKAINGTSAIEHYCRFSVEAALGYL